MCTFAGTLAVSVPSPAVKESGRYRCSISTECVWDPSRIRPTFWIEAAFGVVIWKDVPWLTVPGAPVISGRGASSPEPSFLNRYGGVKISAFFAR